MALGEITHEVFKISRNLFRPIFAASVNHRTALTFFCKRVKIAMLTVWAIATLGFSVAIVPHTFLKGLFAAFANEII